MVDHPSGHAYLTPGTAAAFGRLSRSAPGSAPRLGEHSDEIPADVLGLTASQIGSLHDRKVVAGPEE